MNEKKVCNLLQLEGELYLVIVINLNAKEDEKETCQIGVEFFDVLTYY